MNKKIILITGATDGIGKATAKALAQQGHTIILLGRNPQKTQAVQQELKAQTNNQDINILTADLFSLIDIKRAASEVKKKYDHLDVLINNAGALFGTERETTQEGLEKTMTLNLFAPLLLSELLIDSLKKSPEARIVNVSSEMHRRGGKPDLADIQLANSYTPTRAYGLSKLYSIWASRHLMKELKRKGIENITINMVHPGMARTAFGQDADKGFLNNLIFKLAMPFANTVEEGAAPTVYAATSGELVHVNGKYFGKKEQKIDDKYYSPQNEQAVWDYSQQIIQPYL